MRDAGTVEEQPALSFARLLRWLRDQARLTQEELGGGGQPVPRPVSDLEQGSTRTARKDTALLAGCAELAQAGGRAVRGGSPGTRPGRAGAGRRPTTVRSRTAQAREQGLVTLVV